MHVFPSRNFRARRAATWSSAALMVVLMSPINQNCSKAPADGFPLSYYPMFTKARGQTTKIVHAVAVGRTGDSVDVPARFAGPGGMNTQRRQMRKTVQKGRAADLADRIASRLQGSSFARRFSVERINVVESTYHLHRYFNGERRPVRRVVLASAVVKAGGL